MFLPFSIKEVISAMESAFQPPKGLSDPKSKNLMPSPPVVSRYLLHLEVSILLMKSVCPLRFLIRAPVFLCQTFTVPYSPALIIRFSVRSYIAL
jgi:hypothetical protein